MDNKQTTKFQNLELCKNKHYGKDDSLEMEYISSPSICNKRVIRIFVSVLITILSYIIFLYTSPLYINTDNITIAMVTNGLFGENVYCQYIHPFLCLIVRLVSKLSPYTDVFTLIVHIAIGLSITLLSVLLISICFTPSLLDANLNFEVVREKNNLQNRVIQKKTDSSENKDKPQTVSFSSAHGLKYLSVFICYLLYLLFTTMGISIWNSNYTVQTAFIIWSGFVFIFLYRDSKEESSLTVWDIFGFFLIFFGLLLRNEAALLFIPFVLLKAVIELLSAADIKKAKKSISRWLIPIVGIFILLQLPRTLFYFQDTYKAARRYSDARTTAVDFPMKTWEEAFGSEKHTQPGILQEDYNAVRNWILADTEILDEKLIEEVAENGSKWKYPATIKGIIAAVKEMKQYAFEFDVFLTLFVAVTLILSIRGFFCESSVWYRIENSLALMGGFLILLWFTLKGRALIRVWESVLFAVNTIIIPNAVVSTIQCKARSKHLKFVNVLINITIFMILWVSVGQGISHAQLCQPATPFTSRIYTEDSRNYLQYSVQLLKKQLPYDTSDKKEIPGELSGTSSSQPTDDSVYLWPLWNWQKYVLNGYATMDKLPPKEILDHNIPLGDWVYGQPYFYEHLRNIKLQNPAKALLTRENTYLVEGADETMLSFLRAHYKDSKMDIVFQEVGKIFDLKLYAIRKVEKKDEGARSTDKINSDTEEMAACH